MNILNNFNNMIKNGIKKYLDIEEVTYNANVNVYSYTTYETNLLLNKIWYRGESEELEQIYNQIINETKLPHFWGNKGYRIIKIHTGLPGMIVDTLSDVVVDSLASIKVGERQSDWEAIANENNFKELLRKALITVLWGGDGAFKWSYDPEISKYPIIEFYPPERVEYVTKRGRLVGIIYKTKKIINKKEYLLYEEYTDKGIDYRLYNDNGKLENIKLLEKAENTVYKPIKNNANFLMGRKFLLKESQKYENRGKSIFEGKVDNFDAYDEIWSQWMLSVRKGQVKEYIPEDLLPRDLKTGVMKRKSDFENEFILLSSTMGEGDKNNLIQTTQGTIQHEGLLTSYITALDQCLTGLISPSTLGIDTKKLDNAEASREKEKTTLYKRSQIVDSMRKLIEDIVNITFKFYDNLNGKAITDTKCEVVFTEYANPSFEAQVETIGKANTAGIMSVEATVEQLWGDNKKEDWKNQEIKRLKNEKGIMEEVEPAVNKDNIDIIEEEQKE